MSCFGTFFSNDTEANPADRRPAVMHIRRVDDRGILQFTSSNAACCVLLRHASRVVHRLDELKSPAPCSLSLSFGSARRARPALCSRCAAVRPPLTDRLLGGPGLSPSVAYRARPCPLSVVSCEMGAVSRSPSATAGERLLSLSAKLERAGSPPSLGEDAARAPAVSRPRVVFRSSLDFSRSRLRPRQPPLSVLVLRGTLGERPSLSSPRPSHRSATFVRSALSCRPQSFALARISRARTAARRRRRGAELQFSAGRPLPADRLRIGERTHVHHHSTRSAVAPPFSVGGERSRFVR